jgi:hypothetical protein
MAVKFMQSLDPQVYTHLTKIAKARGISMQELIRAVIVPDWMKKAEDGSRKSSASGRKVGHARRLRRLRPRAHA